MTQPEKKPVAILEAFLQTGQLSPGDAETLNNAIAAEKGAVSAANDNYWVSELRAEIEANDKLLRELTAKRRTMLYSQRQQVLAGPISAEAIKLHRNKFEQLNGRFGPRFQALARDFNARYPECSANYSADAWVWAYAPLSLTGRFAELARGVAEEIGYRNYNPDSLAPEDWFLFLVFIEQKENDSKSICLSGTNGDDGGVLRDPFGSVDEYLTMLISRASRAAENRDIPQTLRKMVENSGVDPDKCETKKELQNHLENLDRNAFDAATSVERVRVARRSAVDLEQQEQKIGDLRNQAYAEVNQLAYKCFYADAGPAKAAKHRFALGCEQIPKRLWDENKTLLSHLPYHLFVSSIWKQSASWEDGNYSLATLVAKKADIFSTESESDDGSEIFEATNSRRPLGDNPYSPEHPNYQNFEDATWKAESEVAKLEILYRENFRKAGSGIECVTTYSLMRFNIVAEHARVIVLDEESMRLYEAWLSEFAGRTRHDLLKAAGNEANRINLDELSSQLLDRISRLKMEAIAKLQQMRRLAEHKAPPAGPGAADRPTEIRDKHAGLDKDVDVGQTHTNKPLYARNIRFLRDRCGWSQDELAKKIGTAKARIYEHENGLKLPRHKFSGEYAMAFTQKLGFTVTKENLHTTDWRIEAEKRAESVPKE